MVPIQARWYPMYLVTNLRPNKARGLEHLFVVALVVCFSICLVAQTASTGAITGVITDPSGALVAGATVRLQRTDGIETKSADTDRNGQFGFLLLGPGAYSLTATKNGFNTVQIGKMEVPVTETVRVDLRLELPTRTEQVQVLSNERTIDLGSSSLGRVVSEPALKQLPLVTRNFTQIATLSPGVIASVYNAGELGVGGTALSQIGKSNDGIYVHGSRSYDNNWQIDGVSVSDVLGSGAISGGIPIPNPDTLQEFKVQTGLYDAAFGRGPGANVSVVTNSGSNDFQGTLFEFLRNKALNANDYFLNQAGQPRPYLNQNQFGIALGGPIRKNTLVFFGSYQRTQQKNGLAAGQSRIACSATLVEPALSDNRSAAALGKLFGGKTGALGGIAVASDGSNINPVALALLNFKLPDGSYLIPTPQRTDITKPLASQGFSAFSEPCRFDEDQFLLNLDWRLSTRNSLSSRLFFASNDQLVIFPGGALNPVGNIQGFPSPADSQFIVYSLTHRYQGGSSWLSETKFGFVQTATSSEATSPFKWSDVGVSEGEMNNNNELPSLSILGSVSMASVLPRTYRQNSFTIGNTTSFLRGSHMLKFGGALTRFSSNETFSGAGSYVQFLSWPDFLLGLNAAGNGTGTFSNVFGSSDIYGLLDRKLNSWEGSAFAQDNYRVLPTFTLTLGLRYERIGQLGDGLGRASSFDISQADKQPPPSGSLDGYIVSSNYPGTVPAGVVRAGNSSANYGNGQNALAPRVGFAWQVLPHSTRLAAKGGYGIYYSRPTGQTATLSVLAAPFASTRIVSGTSNATANFQFPFAQPFPQPDSFPSFVPYSPTSSIAITALSPNFRPALVQQFSLSTEWVVHEGWFAEVGYVGARATHLQRYRSLNQALSASPEAPVNGVTTNTLANIGQRVPIPGIRPDSLRETESEGNSWYNGLEASLTKRLAHGIQLLASYTFSKTLDTDGADINSTSANNALTLGDQNSPSQRWGRASFDRTHRFILSMTAALPSPSAGPARTLLGGWSVAAIVTIQSGAALTVSDTNSTNVFGISQDRAQLTGTCSKSQLLNAGSVESKLDSYFNTPCFTTPLVIGSDGIGTGFGDSGTGMVDGPGQANVDIAIGKSTKVSWPRENSSVELRAEFFNALNHPQFANPDSNFSSPTFGVISSTAVNPRVGQLAVKFIF
jgi:Carboxypeptidase regulatory-like domain/TonB dependent receptor-like, beta-barrel